MKIILGNKKENIELGDVLISDKGKYLVVKNTDTFPIELINLESMEQRNAFKDLQALNSSYYIVDVEPIIKVIKSKNLVITEE